MANFIRSFTSIRSPSSQTRTRPETRVWCLSFQFDLVQISEDTIRTRGNKYKLIQHHCSYYDLRKFNFTNRVIPVWNSLPNRVVSADTINTFKNRLDNFGSDQEVLYDYNADLHGIGNRSLL